MSDINKRLRDAARDGAEAELKVLLGGRGCNALAKDEIGMTALMWAAYHGQEVCVQLLLPVSDASATGDIGQTALMWAARGGNAACLNHLLPVSDALATDRAGRTALIWATIHGHEACVELLLPVSDALSKDDNNSMTALVWAACYGREACVRLLLPASDLLQNDRNGQVASALAREKGHESLAQFIEVYTLAQSERAAIGVAVHPGGPRGRVAPRL